MGIASGREPRFVHILAASLARTQISRTTYRIGEGREEAGLTTRPISSSKLLVGPLRISEDINFPIGKMRDFGRPASHHGQFLIAQFAGVNAAQYSVVSFIFHIQSPLAVNAFIARID
jgi:hypothetical protein